MWAALPRLSLTPVHLSAQYSSTRIPRARSKPTLLVGISSSWNQGTDSGESDAGHGGHSASCPHHPAKQQSTALTAWGCSSAGERRHAGLGVLHSHPAGRHQTQTCPAAAEQREMCLPWLWPKAVPGQLQDLEAQAQQDGVLISNGAHQ